MSSIFFALFRLPVFSRERAGNGINIQKLSLCKQSPVPAAVENPVCRGGDFVENPAGTLEVTGKHLWKTLWKMFITFRT